MQSPDPIVIDGVDLSLPAPGRLLPPRAFTSPEVFEIEQRAVFARSWIHIADLVDLQGPGDYAAGEIGRTPVFVIRGRDGQLRGFLNACRHRGATVVEGRGRCERQIRCPYHAWSYGTDGKLLGVPHRDQFPPEVSERGLVPIRIATLGPMVFGCVDPSAPPFAEWAGELAAAVERAGAGSFELAYELSWEVDANWKIFVENANDGYHIRFVHDVLTDLVDLDGDGETVCETHGAYSYAPINPAYVLPGVSPEQAVIRFGHLFPNLIPVLTPVDLSYLRVDPIAPDKLRVVARSFDALPADSPLREFRRLSVSRTTDQDIEVVLRTQRGLHAEGLPAGVFADQLEARVAHFERMLSRAIGDYLGERSGSRPLALAPAPARPACV